jgi:hypothetical protein
MFEIETSLGPRIKNLSEGNIWALAMLFRPDYPRDYSRRPNPNPKPTLPCLAVCTQTKFGVELY